MTTSCTVTVKVPVLVLFEESCASQETIVMPGANVLPEAGAQVTATLPSHTSLALALKLTTVPAVVARLTRMFAGSDSTGAAVSVTVSTATLLVTLPLALLTTTV